jgi:hypothetical protein
MKTLIKFPLLKFLILLFLLFGTQLAFADEPVASPTPSTSNGSAPLVVHKPATDPAWGKVIQYQEEKTVSTGDKTGETLHKFLFQDSNGIIRVAIYHESESGTGYWEVWVWDQP